MVDKYWNASFVAKLFGVTFVAIGLVAFVPNPITSSTGIFETNAAHNIVHIVTGAAFLAGAYAGVARPTLRAIALLYVVVAIAGFLTSGHLLLGLVHINDADRWLHAALAVAFVAVSSLAPEGGRLCHARA